MSSNVGDRGTSRHRHPTLVNTDTQKASEPARPYLANGQHQLNQIDDDTSSQKGQNIQQDDRAQHSSLVTKYGRLCH